MRTFYYKISLEFQSLNGDGEFFGSRRLAVGVLGHQPIGRRRGGPHRIGVFLGRRKRRVAVNEYAVGVKFTRRRPGGRPRQLSGLAYEDNARRGIERGNLCSLYGNGSFPLNLSSLDRPLSL